jgi:hypothetical protein
MKRLASTLVALASVLLFLAVCTLWLRARSASDNLSWTWYRQLPDDNGPRGTELNIDTDQRRLWITVMDGRTGPYNGQLVSGYHINADNNHGRPRLTHDRQPYDRTLIAMGYDPDAGSTGWGPVRWQYHTRSRPKDFDDHHSLRVGLSHWFLAVIFLLPTPLWLRRLRANRRDRLRKLGLCPTCHYDLRATPGRCPECGTDPAAYDRCPAG